MPALNREKPAHIIPPADILAANASLGSSPLVKRLGLPSMPGEVSPPLPKTPRTPKSASSTKSIWPHINPFRNKSQNGIPHELLDNYTGHNYDAGPQTLSPGLSPPSQWHRRLSPRTPGLRPDRGQRSVRAADLPITPSADYFSTPTTAERVPPYWQSAQPSSGRANGFARERTVSECSSGRSGRSAFESTRDRPPSYSSCDSDSPVCFVMDPNWTAEQGEPRFCRVSNPTDGLSGTLDAPDYLWDTPGEAHKIFLKSPPPGRRARRVTQATKGPS
ncbi:hypothetical protein EV121DRAFT_288674 [Schizophyllum commune]